MKNTLILFLTLLLLVACSDEYLNKKPSKSLVVPATLADLDALLNNTDIMNFGAALPVIGVDDYFMSDEGWQAIIDPVEKYAYTWESDIYRGAKTNGDWTSLYQQVYYSNTVLDALTRIERTTANQAEYDKVKGRALFHRAFAHYQVAQLFCLPYHTSTLDAPGIPLHLNPDITAPITRATVNATYTQVLADLKQAEALLPVAVPSRTQPTQASAKALLAIISIAMENSKDAEAYATGSLDLDNTLIDYNEVSITSTRPFSRYNAEVSFHSQSTSYEFQFSTQAFIDTLLYASYEQDDIRKAVFFRNRDVNRYTFKGNYTGGAATFTGIGINEVYLVRAEARVRNGNISGALDDLNALLIKRWKTGTYIPVTQSDPAALLSIILSEKKKELLYRPARWTDTRRLNFDPLFQRTMARTLNGELHQLTPKDKRYVYQIPPEEILYSKIEQNPR